LILRSFDTRGAALCLSLLWLPLAASAQQTPPSTPVQTTPTPLQTTPSTAAQQQTAQAAPASGKKPKVPDYPDPRTLTIGVFWWQTIPGSGPNIMGGALATGYGSETGLGADHGTPGIEVSVPITRTGVLHLEGFESRGDGTKTEKNTTTVFSTPFMPGDFLSNSYNIRSAKLYLEDLFHPYKFPVSRFRLNTLWEVQVIDIGATLDAPLKAVNFDSSGNAIPTTAVGAKTNVLPSFGFSAEYAIRPHILFRAAATGFGLPHWADLWDADATVSYRRKDWEIVGGFKALHFKTSPKGDEYLSDTLSGAIVSIRHHF
jgi:hypothetical protein